MSITVELSPNLSDQLKRVDNVDAFVEGAVRREFNRQRAIGKIQKLAKEISSRPEAKALSDDQLDELLNDL